jgi:hypothetical protein
MHHSIERNCCKSTNSKHLDYFWILLLDQLILASGCWAPSVWSPRRKPSQNVEGTRAGRYGLFYASVSPNRFLKTSLETTISANGERDPGLGAVSASRLYPKFMMMHSQFKLESNCYSRAWQGTVAICADRGKRNEQHALLCSGTNESSRNWIRQYSWKGYLMDDKQGAAIMHLTDSDNSG